MYIGFSLIPESHFCEAICFMCHVNPLLDFIEVYLSLNDYFSQRNTDFGTLVNFLQR